MGRKNKEINIEKKYNTIASEYESLKQERQPYLDKARNAAKYTFPTMYQKDSYDSRVIKRPVRTENPNQSIGADGVNNLSSKMTLTMLPPNQPFFKFKLDYIEAKKMEIEGEDAIDEINRGLSVIETMISDYIEELGDRVCLGEGLKHLYIAGNVFFIHDPKTGMRMYPLDRYCVKRDYTGNVLKAITEETISVLALPDELREKVIEKLLNEDNKCDIAEKEVTLFTRFKREKNNWLVSQEVEGFEIEKSQGIYPIEIAPFIALRYTRIDGESYGRSLIEEYIGDISYLDSILKAIKAASLAASKFIMLVNPRGLTKIKDLAEAPNGGFAAGREEDVKALQANKYYDLQTAQSEADKIERRLNRIFIMKAAIQRQAERVTAEEIRQMAADLEEALGNHYALMCREFQLAYVKIVFFHLKRKKKNEIPDLIRNEAYHLTVTTGLETLGRSSELQKWNTFFDIMTKFAQSAQIIGAKTDKIATMVATSLNLDIRGLILSDEEKMYMQQEQQQQELLKTAAPNLINQYGNIAQEQIRGQVKNGEEETSKTEAG